MPFSQAAKLSAPYTASIIRARKVATDSTSQAIRFAPGLRGALQLHLPRDSGGYLACLIKAAIGHVYILIRGAGAAVEVEICAARALEPALDPRLYKGPVDPARGVHIRAAEEHLVPISCRAELPAPAAGTFFNALTAYPAAFSAILHIPPYISSWPFIASLNSSPSFPAALRQSIIRAMNISKYSITELKAGSTSSFSQMAPLSLSITVLESVTE